MRYKVIVSDLAKAEYRAIHQGLKEKYGKRTAAKFKTTFASFLKAIAVHPRQYPEIPELRGVRKCSGMSPTIIFYEVGDHTVTVHMLRDGRRGEE